MEDKLYTIIGKLFVDCHELQNNSTKLEEALKAKDVENAKLVQEMLRLSQKSKNAQEPTRPVDSSSPSG